MTRPRTDEILTSLETHVRNFFSSRTVREMPVDPQIYERLAPFRVLEVSPEKDGWPWMYVSLGASSVEGRQGERLEFFILAPERSERATFLVTMAAWYHASQDVSQRLGLGDTLPIGEPWINESLCDHYLVSLPHPFGPDFEVFNGGTDHVHFFWLLPITQAERDFKIESGQEALEQIFERVGVQYWRPDRESVV